jgi:hypothetical protein
MLRRVALVRSDVLPKRWFLQEPNGVPSQKMEFFIVTAVKTSNLTSNIYLRFVNTAVYNINDVKMFNIILFYLHPTVCFDL